MKERRPRARHERMQKEYARNMARKHVKSRKELDKSMKTYSKEHGRKIA